MKILVVDDNADILKSSEIIIKSIGHEVSAAMGGREALEKIRTEKFDTVFLDLAMPEFSGMDVVDALFKEGLMSKQKVILFTATHLDNADLNDYLQKGIHSTLPKPADVEDIMKKIQDIAQEINT